MPESNKRFNEIFIKVAQGMADPMAGGDMSGMMPPEMMGGMPGSMPMGGAPVPPTPEEAAMMFAQQGTMGAGAPVMTAEGDTVNQDAIVASQADAISSLADSVKTLTNLHASTGNDPMAAAENIAATMVGSGAMGGMTEEDLPPVMPE